MQPNPENFSPQPRQVLVCQNITCRQQGATDILKAFCRQGITDAQVIDSGCLGECGNGPMVLVQPEQIWYNNVRPRDVSKIVAKHLRSGEPVRSMLYRKYHPLFDGRSLPFWQMSWVIVLLGFILLLGFTAIWVIEHQI